MCASPFANKLSAFETVRSAVSTITRDFHHKCWFTLKGGAVSAFRTNYALKSGKLPSVTPLPV